MTFLGVVQSFAHLTDGLGHGVGPMQEVHGTGTLHDLRPGVPGHFAKAIVAEDDGSAFELRIGDHKLTIWREKVMGVVKEIAATVIIADHDV